MRMFPFRLKYPLLLADADLIDVSMTKQMQNEVHQPRDSGGHFFALVGTLLAGSHHGVVVTISRTFFSRLGRFWIKQNLPNEGSRDHFYNLGANMREV